MRPIAVLVLLASTVQGMIFAPIVAAQETKPAWIGSREGVCDGLPPQWEALDVHGNTVQPWGRQYLFDGLPGPTAVAALGESILARPMRFVARVRGREVAWRSESTQTVKLHDGAAEVTTLATADGLQLKGEIRVEFDGMIRADWQIVSAVETTLDTLCFEMPYKASLVKYLYTYPGSWGSARNAGSAPKEPLNLKFMPYLWMGDEQRGLCWFSESDKNFSNDDPEKVIQIVPGETETILRVNLVTKPKTLGADSPLEYTFGFQATPVRDNPKDVWDYRICHHGDYGIEDKPYFMPMQLRYPTDGNLNPDAGTIEAWVRVNFDPTKEIADPQKRGEMNVDLLDITLPDASAKMGFYWNIDDRGMRTYFRQGADFPFIAGAKCDWKQGEWHHVAVTWGDAVRVWVDGKKTAENAYSGGLKAFEKGAAIVFYIMPGTFDLGGVRVSDIARDAFATDAPPADDEHTRLLDGFDKLLSGAAQTQPAKGSAGTLVNVATASGKWGQCLIPAEAAAKTTTLDRLAELGVRTVCFHEHWTDIQNYTSTTHGEELKKLVTACHERGIRLLLYFGYEISDIAPEWAEYSDACLTAPRAGGYHRLPEQHAYIVCYRSMWQDFMAYGIAKMMDDYGIDGVYLDGTANPWPCANTKHGCGYVKEDGSIAPVYPIFSTREMMKRIWTLVKTRKPEGLVNVHQSTCMTIPTLAFATSYWDGEQFGGIPRGSRALDVLPLDAFRCEFMGRQWGVPSEMLCYNQPYTYSEATSFALLHDVLVRGGLGGALEMESKLWKAMETFGRHEAQWHPYWDDQKFVQTDGNDTKVSLYTRGKQGVVAVVSNLGQERRTVHATLQLDALGLSGTLEGKDVVNECAVPISGDGGISFDLNALDFRVVLITSKE